MTRFHRRGARFSRPAEVNMAPLIDMVFVLLIFFLVTTSFVKEAGVDVRRPEARTAVSRDNQNILIGVSSAGEVFLEGHPTDVRMLRARIQTLLAESPRAKVLVVADEQSHTGRVVQVIDQCRMAGVDDVGIAAREPEP